MRAEAGGVPVIACVPSAIEASERQRHFALARELFDEQAETRESLPDGLAFTFPPDSLDDVARFIANERKCCPFMRFEVTVAAEMGVVTLRMTGPVGTRELLEAELELQSSCGCK